MSDRLKQIEWLELLAQSIKEANTTANADGYNTPYAFRGKKKKKIKQIIGKTQGKQVGNLEESYSYRKYKNLNSTNREKLNRNIIAIHKKLDEVVKLLDNATRLKQECGMTYDLWKLSPSRINKVLRKILYINNKIKELK